MPNDPVKFVTRKPKVEPEVELLDTDADTGEETGEETSEETKSTGKVKGETGAQQVLEAFGGIEFLTALVSDPDIQAILSARREGSKINVVLDGQRTGGESEETAAATEETAEVDELTEELDDDTKKILKALRLDIRSQLKPLTDEVNALKSIADNYQKREVSSQIATVASKNPDFNKYRKAMADIARKTPGLSVEEMLILAKNRAGELNVTKESTHSERPTPTPRRRAVGHKKSGTALGGRKAFQEVLADALGNLEFVEE